MIIAPVPENLGVEWLSVIECNIVKLVLLLLFSVMLGASITYAQGLQVGSGQEGTVGHAEEVNTDKMYEAWMLAVRYRFEEAIEGKEVAHDPNIVQEIAELRGDSLGYFLDSIEAINQVETIMFPPSAPDSKASAGITISEERELVEIVTANIFHVKQENVDPMTLNERNQAYVTELQALLTAIVEGNGDSFFSVEYLEYRTKIIPFIEDTDAGLFTSSQEAVDDYLEYFGIDKEDVNLDLNPTQKQSCPITNTVDNYPYKSTSNIGHSGTFWYEGQASDQTDCDIWIGYPMGGAVSYGKVSASTSSAQCVLDKTNHLRGDWSVTYYYNQIQYGKNTVTWGWPFGCSTTGSALMSGTRWRP